jgi:hypothetical protein
VIEIEILFEAPFHLRLYLWTAPAWLAWYLWVRTGNYAMKVYDPSVPADGAEMLIENS